MLRTLTPLTSFARAGFVMIGALLLAGAAVALFVRLAHFVPHWQYLLLIVLLIPLGVIAVPKIWARPALGVAGTMVLIAVPWRTGGEGAEFAHITLPDLAAVALVGIVTVRVLVLGDQGRLRSWVWVVVKPFTSSPAIPMTTCSGRKPAISSASWRATAQLSTTAEMSATVPDCM